MSLIRVRRNRKKTWIDTKKSRSPIRMTILLAALLAAAWYVARSFGV